jgi:hypothetical protein
MIINLKTAKMLSITLEVRCSAAPGSNNWRTEFCNMG